MQHLETYHGRDFKTVYRQAPFTLLFHDATKLRIRLSDHDVSVPISVLLFSIIQLLTKREISSRTCREVLGKDWGFAYIARILLECDDVCLEPNGSKLVLNRIRRSKGPFEPVKPPPNGCRALNPMVR